MINLKNYWYLVAAIIFLCQQSVLSLSSWSALLPPGPPLGPSMSSLVIKPHQPLDLHHSWLSAPSVTSHAILHSPLFDLAPPNFISVAPVDLQENFSPLGYASNPSDFLPSCQQVHDPPTNLSIWPHADHLACFGSTL